MVKRPYWFSRPTGSCTCDSYVDSRLVRYRSQSGRSPRRSGSSRPETASTARHWLSRQLRRLRRVKASDLLAKAVIAALLIYAGLTVFHLTQGFGFISALGGGIQDIRVVGVCFGEWGEMQEFIARDSFLGKDPGRLALDLSGGECGPW